MPMNICLILVAIAIGVAMTLYAAVTQWRVTSANYPAGSWCRRDSHRIVAVVTAVHLFGMLFAAFAVVSAA